MPTHPINPQVAQSLAAKLEAFCATLTSDELAAFEQIEAQLDAHLGTANAGQSGDV